MRYNYSTRPCSCGSGRTHYPLHDGHGIFLTYACESCEKEKLSKFRPDILEQYECDEPLDGDFY
jgi:hypothetical protein